MNYAEAVRGITYAVLLVWMIFLLVRAPRNLPLRAITAAIACWTAAFPFTLFANAEHLPGVPLLNDRLFTSMIEHGFLILACYFLVCFILFTLYAPRTARRLAWIQLGPALLAALVLAAVFLSIPAEQHDAVGRVIVNTLNDRHTEAPASAGVFFLTANSYQFYAFLFAFVITCGYARSGVDRLLRRGMLLAAIGLGGLAFGSLTFAMANVARLLGHAADWPYWIVITGAVAVFAGIPVFLVGIGYRSGYMRVASMRVWWQHRRDHRSLYTLWSALHEHFPEDELHRVPRSRRRDLFSLRGVHRRYYRRVIECRDGLVRASPYIAQVRADGLAEASLADQLVAALRVRGSGRAVAPQAVPVAAPSGTGLDADVRELVVLSRALQATSNGAP